MYRNLTLSVEHEAVALVGDWFSNTYLYRTLEVTFYFASAHMLMHFLNLRRSLGGSLDYDVLRKFTDRYQPSHPRSLPW